MSLCGICLAEEDTAVICPSNKCNSIICNLCFEEMMDFCLTEGKMICCTNNLCEQQYPKTTIPDNLLEKYVRVTHNYLSKTHSDIIEEGKSYRAMVQTLQEEKKKFIQTKFPKAISLVVTVSYPHALNKISRNNEKLTKASIQSRRCINFVCKGKMIQEKDLWKCLVCKGKFCFQCEMEYKMGHYCKESDVESVKAVQNMVKCPKCKCPAVKSQGCNSITCAVCRTNFDYLTGEHSISGNHTHDEALGLKEHVSLLEMYQNYNDELKEILVEIDAKHPKIPTLKPIISLLEKDANSEEITKKYSSYLLRMCKISNYMNAIGAIEHESRTEEGLTKDFLLNVLGSL